MKHYQSGLMALAACHALLLTGCTSVLWEQERFAKFHWPAEPPNLRLFYSATTRDALVEYDEASDGAKSTNRRAYWLERNAQETATDRQPHFVSVKNTSDLVPIPITSNLVEPPQETYRGLYAVVSANGQTFTLCTSNKEPITHQLPAYYAGSGQRVKQVLLTPFAVAIDATLIGGTLAAIIAAHEVSARCLEHHYCR